MKKFILCILLLCLVSQMLPVPAGAAETVSGMAERREGYEVATIRCEKADSSYFFVDFTETAEGYAYSFAPPEGSYSVITEYYSLSVWDGAVDISWYNAEETEFHLSTPAQLAGLAALVNGQVDETTPDYRIRGDRSELVSTRIDNYQLVGAGGGNQYGTVFQGDSAHDFSDKTVYLDADMDMGGTSNWTPIGGKYPMQLSDSERLIEAFFNGTLDGQGHRITNLKCDRYSSRGYAYSQAIGLIGYLGELYDGESAPANAPSVRNLSVSGSIYGRRMVGGIVGRIGSIPTGVFIENCANYASVKNTDSKGVGGIVGAGWGTGAIVNCYNAGSVTTTYACPAGGIVGSNSGLDVFCCYNVGKIDSSGNSRGRAIGGHDSGNYTVSDCYYLAGCDDDPASNGWYCGTAINITVSVQELSEGEMRADTLVSLLNRNGEAFVKNDGGYPMLFWERDAARTDCALTLTQPDGGMVCTNAAATVPSGTVLRLSDTPQVGWSFRCFTLNGNPLSGRYATITHDAIVSALFEPMVSGTLSLQPHPACTISVVKTGTASIDGVMTPVTNYPVKDGDPLFEGDELTVTAVLVPNAEPDDLNYVYNGEFRYIFTYCDEQAATTQTDTGKFRVSSNITAASLSISAEPYTTHKVWTQLAETGWYDSRQTEFTLYTARQLAGLASLVKGGISFSGKTVRLGADISLSNDDKAYNRSIRWFDGIGSLQHPFCGTFDGCGHQITHMTAVSQGSNAALFLATDGAVIKNLIVYGESSANGSAAAVVAQAKNTQIITCENHASVSTVNDTAGGFVACADAATVIRGCKNYGAISGADGLGGIAGVVKDKDTQLSDCMNYGSVAGNGASTGIGGIAGRVGGSLLRCANYGAVSGKGWYIGGLVGVCSTDGGGRITDCYNVGTVSNAHSYASGGTGGLVGYGNYFQIKNCYNSGSVSASAGTSGAILGKNSKRAANQVQNTFALDTSCAFVSHSEATLAGVQSLSKEILASQDFLCLLNQDACFALYNGSYPEFSAGCPHLQTALQNGKAATCIENGYTGDTVCLMCGMVLASGSEIPKTICPGLRFTDMPTGWAHPGIDFVLEKGLFTGTSDTTIDPDGDMTRAMLVTVLWRLDGKTAPTTKCPFTDVPEKQWYTEAVIWAAENKVVNGVGEGKFEPDGKISREQMAAVLFRYAGEKGYDTSKRADLSYFPDGGKTSSWAKDALSWANAEGLVAGSAQGSDLYLLPTGNATRAQVAAILMRYMNNIVNG